MPKLQQLIKWTGSKRSQCEEISKYINNNYENYYEPFCGSCALGFYLIYRHNFKRYIFSDINKDLIQTYNTIKDNPLKDNPQKICTDYRNFWNELNKDDSIERKKEYYAQVRKYLNEEHDPSAFFFIMRTVQNGMPRYNAKGEFNNAFHITRCGAKPDLIDKIVAEYSKLFNTNNVYFINRNYDEIKSTENDLVYLDPPYFNTKGIYFGKIDYNHFFEFLRNLKSDFLLSFDGISTKDNTVEIPKVYDKHVYIDSGKSSFQRVKNNVNVEVFESLYIKTRNVSEDW